MRSMTGFGRAVNETEICRVEVRIRSVNHRFLDLALRVPEEYRHQEAAIRETVTKRLHRGRVELRLDIDDRRDRQVHARVDGSVLEALRQVSSELEGEGIPLQGLQLSDLLRIPDAIRISAIPATPDSELDQPIHKALAEALDQVERARQSEGTKLEAALRERLDALQRIVRQISARKDDVLQELAARFRQRLDGLLEDTRQLDEDRLAQEVALIVERADVQEELDRLLAHGEHFREVMRQEGAVGRKLDFLAQEIFRELSTLAAKCRQMDVLQPTLEAKLLCEQLREQIQNIE